MRPDPRSAPPGFSRVAEPRHAASARGRHAAGASDWSSPTISHPARAVGANPDGWVGYERGAAPRWHAQLVERAADVAVAAMPIALRVLDIGCGDGQLLGELVVRAPYADAYIGLDPVADAVSVARRSSDLRISFVRGAAEALPFADGSFDLVVAVMSLRYWTDQRAGIAELARVVSDTGTVVIVDAPDRRILDLLAEAGLPVGATETLHRSPLMRPIARAFMASP